MQYTNAQKRYPTMKKIISNWGNFPKQSSQVFSPINKEEVAIILDKQPRLSVRGNGRSYGDAGLAEVTISTLKFNKILHFNAENGLITCQCGVLLRDILLKVVPFGWFFNVTPGTKYVTVGGAVASDIHGKNHPIAGCFSQHLQQIELMLSDGKIVQCSKTENALLFWQTCGGMGWTGVILSATFQLRKIVSTKMKQKTMQIKNFDGIFSAFESVKKEEHRAVWIDCFAKGKNQGRSILYAANHDEMPNQELVFKEKMAINMPTFFPSLLMNKYSIQLQNELIYHKNATKTTLIELNDYFYPLDGLKNWNRFYGKKGFIQYQFCLPEIYAFEGLRNVLNALQHEKIIPYLAVLKQHGLRPMEAIHSFPIAGFSLALDFPNTKETIKMVQKLDEIVWKYEGKIYLAKDACSTAKMSKIAPNSFGNDKFQSIQKMRIQ
jgi:decaprenylphospho-beta-D-ribofuranose 2-oxidase